MKKIFLVLAMGMMVSLSALAQWGRELNESVAIETHNDLLNETRIAKAPNGYTWYYALRQRDYYRIETSLQLVDTLGNPVFDEMLLVSNHPTRSVVYCENPILVDRDGNAIVAVHDTRDEQENKQRLSYYIYKISQDGEFLWGADGINIEKNTTSSSHISMTQLDDGSYVIAWEYADEYFVYSIRMQRLSADGELLWDTAELELTDTKTADPAKRISYKYPTVVNAGFNQVIMTYISGSNQELFARKIDFDGSAVWAEDTRIHRNGWSGGAAPWKLLCVEPSGDGGVVVSWNDDRFATGSQAYMNYVTPDGELAFADGINGLQLSYAELISTQVACKYDPYTDTFLAIFREALSSSYWRVAAQRVSKDGEPLWGETAYEIVPLIPNQCGDFNIEIGPDGTAAFFYVRNETTVTKSDCYVRLVDIEDPTIYQETRISDYSKEKYNYGLKTTELHDGKFWVAQWLEDTNPGVDSAEYRFVNRLQRINVDLTLGCEKDAAVDAIQEENAIFTAVTTMVDNEAAFAINLPDASQATLAIYDINGTLVAQPHEGMMAAGKHYVAWEANAPAGIYLATLTTRYGVNTIKILVK